MHVIKSERIARRLLPFLGTFPSARGRAGTDRGRATERSTTEQELRRQVCRLVRQEVPCRAAARGGAGGTRSPPRGSTGGVLADLLSKRHRQRRGHLPRQESQNYYPVGSHLKIASSHPIQLSHWGQKIF